MDLEGTKWNLDEKWLIIELFEIVWNLYNPNYIHLLLKACELPSKCSSKTHTLWEIMQVSVVNGDLVLIKLINIYDMSWIQLKD